MRTLLIVSAIAILIACNSEKQESSEISSQIRDEVFQLSDYEDSLLSLLNYSDEYISLLNQNKNNFTANPRIPRSQAKARIELYKLFEALDRTSRGQTYDPKKDIYGFTFDFESVYNFVMEIKAHNDDPNTHKDSIITGIRAYKSFRSFNNLPLNEIFLVPTLNSQKNFYAIDDDLDVKSSRYTDIIEELNVLAGDDLILDSSVPCPNSCN